MDIPNGYIEISPGIYGKTKNPAHCPKKLPDPKSQPVLRKTLEPVFKGKAASPTRIIVRITSYRCRLCDPDNCIAGCKPLIDQLRYAGLIPDDRPQDIKLESEQIKVSHLPEQKTTIDLIYP